MSNNIRVIVCGTGGIGAAVLKEAIRAPWIDVVGVLVYSEAKEGVDAGTLVGLPPIGVKTSRSMERMAATPADCVLYCAQDLGDNRNDAPMMNFLRSGRNVITSLAYGQPRLRPGGEKLTEAIEQACREGGTRFHATGINPGYILERMLLLCTGLSQDIQHVKAEEFFDCSQLNASLMGMFGIGLPVAQAKKLDAAMRISNLYLTQGITYACNQLGVQVDKIEQEQFFKETPEDIRSVDMEIKRGTVGSTSYRWTVYAGGKPFFVKENTWFMTRLMQPIKAETTENWRITIEGRPSIRLFLEAEASWDRHLHLYENDPTAPGYYACGVTMIQMLQVIREGKPGIVPPPAVGPHWNTRFR